ncbi:MAG: TRAP transporter large permease [Synergistaceae bacterium]|uniref:TRAP transporter large permease n=1 Tax=Aminivibrio sp. TaxID=1872489 RepID=UPI001D8DBEEA|nr:TRAP transporter large permease [Synergistaceae bacterium]NCC57430.1 TRAP transporter large permease [Synergistales bacterium]MDD3390072.1 TRAP transporter large permease [Synergistaceae bacterium]MDD3688819.1 TRAP transporter large permease [Synergistaceae bacterium]MDD4020307.1 TRAP transporter large permease [Synergistaceae bacterium]
MSIFLVLFFIFFLFIGVPIAVSLGLTCIFSVLVTGAFGIEVLIQKTFNAGNSFALMAIPFFILAGNIMAAGGVSRRLVNLAGALFGRMSGGLALVATLASTFFGAVSGSAPATTAAIGGVMLGPMAEKGYNKNFAGAVVAASGTIGLIIPPSLTMVLYGVSTGVSIGELFIAGVIPGIIICIVLMTVEYAISLKRGYKGDEPASFKTISRYFREAVFALFMPIIILGGIYAGIFTPTESAAVAVIYGLIVGIFIHRELTWKDVTKLILKSAKSTALVMYLMVTAEVLSYVLVSEQIPQTIAASILDFSTNAIVVQLIMVFILLIVGTFLNNSAAMVLLAPIFYPIIMSLGVDPLFFGIIMVISLAIGHNTPPVGLCLFIACDIGNLKLEHLVKEIIPLVAALIVTVVTLNFFPDVILFLPRMMR